MGKRWRWGVLLGVLTGCAAAAAEPKVPPRAPESRAARVVLPEIEVQGPDQPAPLAPLAPPQDDVRAVPSSTARPTTSSCNCNPGDLLCAMSCAQLGTSRTPASTRGGAFDVGAASSQMSMAATIVAEHCRTRGGVFGSARVTVSFTSNGRVQSARVDSPFATTDTGECIVTVFRQAIVPPFSGSPMAVSKTVRIKAFETGF